MYRGNDPRWLNTLARRFRWLAVPNIAVIFLTLQVLGALSIMSDAAWFGRLALVPQAVVGEGQVWRLLTWLALPVASGLLWLAFALWFLYFVINLIEAEWGDFKTTLYFLVAIVFTVVFSLVTGYPVASAQDFCSTLFLASATLFPEMEIQLYFAIPVKLKWLGWLTVAFVAWRFATGGWGERFYLLAIYSSYFIFFGPTALDRLKSWRRRQKFRAKLR